MSELVEVAQAVSVHKDSPDRFQAQEAAQLPYRCHRGNRKQEGPADVDRKILRCTPPQIRHTNATDLEDSHLERYGGMQRWQQPRTALIIHTKSRYHLCNFARHRTNCDQHAMPNCTHPGVMTLHNAPVSIRCHHASLRDMPVDRDHPMR